MKKQTPEDVRKLLTPPTTKPVCCMCGKEIEEEVLQLASEGKPSKTYHVECLLFSLR